MVWKVVSAQPSSVLTQQDSGLLSAQLPSPFERAEYRQTTASWENSLGISPHLLFEVFSVSATLFYW